MTPLFVILSIMLWGALALLAHTYAVYPVMMRLLARGRRLPEDGFEGDSDLPEVAVLMAVYNEEKVLEETIASILASDYPREKLRLFIGSDGSTDRSEAIVKSFAKADPRVRLVGFGGRNGKIRIVNRLAEGAASEFSNPDKALYALCDANVTWSPPMLRRLASHFKRGQVGLVAAAVCDRVREHAGIGDQEEAYIGQEIVVKFAEGVLWGRVMGAFGACYAIRALLFSPVPPHHIVDDFYQTMASLEQGSDAIVDLDAVCHEAVSTDIREEFRRKRRIAAGNFQNLARFWSFLQPWNSDPATTFAFWSHKGLRWCGPHLLVAAFLACLILAVMHPLHLVPLAGFGAVYAMRGLDRFLSGGKGIVAKLCRFARLRALGFPVTFTLIGDIGDSDYSRGIAALAARHGDWIATPGFLHLEEKQAVLASHTFALHACRIEAFGIAVTEMAAMGCVPFVPASGGAGEIVPFPGLQYTGDEEAVDKIAALLRDPVRVRELADTMPAQAVRFAPSRFVERLRAIVLDFLRAGTGAVHETPRENLRASH